MSYYVKTNEMFQNTLTDWLRDHNIEDYAFYSNAWKGSCNWLFEFEKEEDAMAFKLRWC